MRLVDLYWLAPPADIKDQLRRLAASDPPPWSDLLQLANSRLDFVQTLRIDKILQRALLAPPTEGAAGAPGLRRMKMAVLSSSTVDHLLPALRVSAVRRGIALQTFAGDYGMYLRELQEDSSDLFKFKPDVVLFAFHAQHILPASHPAMTSEEATALVELAAERIRDVWRLARRRFSGQIIQQSLLPVFQPLMGLNERRLPGSNAALLERVNLRIGQLAEEENVDVLDLGRAAQGDGLDAWHDPVLWHRAKQELSPVAAPAYGELAMRLVGAQQGRSAKCLVLDLDNTLWGGVIGDDGLEGIRIGQGSAAGEAFVAFQTYVRSLASRGVILAVCSKNDAANARSPFEKHPDMVLKLDDIACFVANWTDKATNIRQIAEQLNIGIDSLVFVDDNPFERNIVRRELPMVAVPELPEDVGRCLADAGYFEALRVTNEDFERVGQYRANNARENLRASHTDVAGYLRSLNMELRWQPFDRVGLQRIVQLINKTNQFNLTTRRYTESDVLSIMANARALTLQLRLVDQFGDNGIISIIIGKPEGDTMVLDTWLMSCRVLGRQVEEATMNIVAAEAVRLGAERLVGQYIPTKKNGMVRDHYPKLGFERIASDESSDASLWNLNLGQYRPFDTFITIRNSTS
jgi:FkbH-like protein